MIDVNYIKYTKHQFDCLTNINVIYLHCQLCDCYQVNVVNVMMAVCKLHLWNSSAHNADVGYGA